MRFGAGPRAGQSLILAAKARALLAGRFAVTMDDLRALAAPVLRHRVLLNFDAEAENVTTRRRGGRVVPACAGAAESFKITDALRPDERCPVEDGHRFITR